MSGLSGTGVGSSDLSARLKIVDILPTAAAVLLIGALIIAGAPQQAPTIRTFIDHAHEYGAAGLVALSVVVTATSVALQPLERSLIRVLEGYWPRRGRLGQLSRWAGYVQARRRGALLHVAARIDEGWDEQVSAAQAQLSKWPDDQVELLPTALGNRLRAMERRAGAGYGMDAVRSFPRLYLVLPEAATAALNDLRNQLDASVRSCVMSALSAIATLALLFPYGWWLVIPAGLGTLSGASYRASLVAAENYGDLITAAFNVYHLKILDETGVRRPADTDGARRAHAALEVMQLGSTSTRVRYARTLDEGL